ncbi:MAG: amidophosphoribosyltransferase [Peptococcaceae bacterium]|nr:amidophosphoribosyltransferase [Peptococcaceae bacterium]
MGGVFGVVSKDDCVTDVYFGTDYHSHLGTSRGGMAIWDGNHFNRSIHNIENTQFRARFDAEIVNLKGKMGIGCISDTDPQPLTVRSHLGQYAISTVGKINNLEEIVAREFSDRKNIHFMETNKGAINPTEMVSVIIDHENSFKEGLLKVQELIQGSCSILLLTPRGIFVSRDKLGRTPLVLGKKKDAYCVSSESCAFANLGYGFNYELGPGEIVFITAEGLERVSPPGNKMQMCSFLWVYYGYPSSTYEGVSVEAMRYRNGALLARNDNVEVDMVAGVPDSGVGHAIGYSNQSKVPYGRPFIKYTPTWSRSFIPQKQEIRNLVARMKLMPIPELVKGKSLLFCDDSIVRGTQMRETVDLLYRCNAREVHIRTACPPILFGCKYLNFSVSRAAKELAARRAIIKLEGKEPESLGAYCDPASVQHKCMVDCISKELNLTTLKYQSIHDMIKAIGIDEDKLCTYCWNGREL